MAIMKMKKLSVTVISSQKEELLRRLIKFGWVQFDEQELPVTEDCDGGEGNLSRAVSSITELKVSQSKLLSALSVVNKYAPEKTPLLSAKPEVEGEILLEDAGISAALERAEDVLGADDSLKKISAEEMHQRSVIQSLEPWSGFDWRLEKEGTERTAVLMGTVSRKVTLDSLMTLLENDLQEADLLFEKEEKQLRYIAVVCMKEKLTEVQEGLRQAGFSPVNFNGMKGTARDGINLAKAELNLLGEQKEKCFDRITEGSSHRKEMQLAADKLAARIAMAEAEDKLLETDSTVMMSGWIPEEKEPELERMLGDFVCAWDSEEPAEDEYATVPVKLKNNRITNGLNMVTNMYSLPMYGTVDPNPLMAPFFILFFGLMMADIGYGVLMIVAALVAMKKIKPREGSLSFCQLLLWCGVSTLLMGILTGGLFSDIPYQLVHIFNPESTWEGLPYLFSPVYQSETVLYGSMVLGALHLNTGMAVSFVQKVKAGNVADAVWEEGSLWLLLVGGILAVLGIGNVAGVPVVLIVAIIALLFGAGRNAKGFGKVTAAFSCIYNTATGWFGDVLSYSRIMALMLAGGVVGQVFNTVAVMPMKSSGVNVITVIAFLLIFLLGHAMNFGLNLLGCYVHDLRLQCLEFFGKFYQDGGRPFTPLKFSSKFFSAKEN